MKHFITFLIWFFSTLGFFTIFNLKITNGVFSYIFLGYIVLINLIGLFSMLVDKLKAIDGSERISEKMLFRITAIGGGIGTNIGMKVFRHKTKHQNFVFLLPSMTIIQYFVILAIFSQLYFSSQ